LIDPKTYPPVPKKYRPREVYVDTIDPKTSKALKLKGYDPVALCVLPRNTPAEEQHYLRCKARGIEEGTIEADTHQMSMLRLLFKSAGLLDESRGGASIGSETDMVERLSGIEELLADFEVSRHTIDQSTISLVGGDDDDDD
jgi:hypothetical protein